MSARIIVLPHRKGRALAQGRTTLGPEWNQTPKEAPRTLPAVADHACRSPLSQPREYGAKPCTAEPWSFLQVVIWDPAVGDLHPRGLPVPRHPRGGAVLTAAGGTSDGPAPKLPSRAVSPHTTLPYFPVLILCPDLGLRVCRGEWLAPTLTVASGCLLGPAEKPWPVSPGPWHIFCVLSMNGPAAPHHTPTQDHEVLPTPRPKASSDSAPPLPGTG